MEYETESYRRKQAKNQHCNGFDWLSSDNLPSYLQTSVVAQMLSIGGEGGTAVAKKKKM